MKKLFTQEEPKTINLKNDWMFKAFMTKPQSRRMVANLISEITGIDKELLFHATYIGGEEIAKRQEIQKKQSTDMTIKITDHMQIIVEMNQQKREHVFEKNSLYAMSRIVETTTSKKDYTSIILINFDNFNQYETSDPILIFQIQDKKGHIEVNNYISYHVILENCSDKNYNVGKEIKKFAKFLQEKRTIEQLEETYEGDEEYMSVIRTVEELSKDPEFAGYYDIEEKHRQQLEDAKETGMDEGLEQGMIQGKTEANLSTAKKLLQLGVNTIEQIAEVTGLSIEQVEKLKEENE